MARLIGYMANRADRLRDAFREERQAITSAPDQRGAWGIGFYQGDEVLHKKQPTPDGEPIDWNVIAQNVKTDCAMAHVRQATVGGFSVDNTHPFRLRQWLFAHVGTIAGFDGVNETLRSELPDFLRRNLRGSSDSEVFFHMILAGLHAKNQLDAVMPTAATIVGAIAEAVKKIDAVAPNSTLNVLLSNGRAMYAMRHGGPFGYVDRTRTHEEGAADEPARPGSPHLHYVMLVSGGIEVPVGYASLADEHVLSVTRDLELHTHSL